MGARAIVLLVLLAGCASGGTVWLRPGTSVAEAERTFLSCAAEAQRDFPIAERIVADPFWPGAHCRHPGALGCRGYGPVIRSVDRNAGLRDRALAACMSARGYAPATLPACPSNTRGRVFDRQPAATEGLCLSDGRIVAPAG